MELDLDKYEKIIIGLGEELNCVIPGENAMEETEKLRYVRSHVDKNIVEAYNRLADALQGRDYYVITTCTDDLIFQSRLERSRVVAPCGGFGYFQCPDDCSHELLPFDETYFENELPKCPHCGKQVVFNRLPMEHYNEGGYLERWQEYNKWLQSTINKPLLILEVGVDMTYPTVIRFAFEKLALFNKKSKMYRVHPTLAFSTPQIKENCECVTKGAVEFLMDL